MILQAISRECVKDGEANYPTYGLANEYFYTEAVQDIDSRRKLKKRFDNIINISIKKKRSAA